MGKDDKIEIKNKKNVGKKQFNAKIDNYELRKKNLNDIVPKKKKNVKKVLTDEEIKIEKKKNDNKDKTKNKIEKKVNDKILDNKKANKLKNNSDNKKIQATKHDDKSKDKKNNTKNIIRDGYFPKKKRKLKRKFKILLIILMLMCVILLIVYGVNKYNKYQDKIEKEKQNEERNNLVSEINSHYNNYVKVKKDTILYRINNEGKYYEYGTVYENTEVILDKIEINYLTEYFYSKELDCYIKYFDLEPINELKNYGDRYKKYIVFNKNIVTKDEFSLYDQESDNKIYTFKSSMSFPVIINDYDGKYFVEFNNRLLYLLKDDIKEIVSSNNSKEKNASKITTLCYHRIYDSNQKCNDLYICKSKANFEREMKYLNDNNFLTLTMEEMYLYLTKKIQIPKKSVVLTFDDGTLFELGIEILEKYNLNGTGFLKTGSFSDYSVYESPNFELQSHTDKMHVAGICKRETPNQQGGGILCLPEKTVLADLTLSREKLKGAIALAYPFYDYNNRAIELVKKSGFKLAFIGANGVNGRSYPGINLYKIPRMTIWNTTSFETFKGYVNN